MTAALEVFGERGFHRTTLDEVARRAGVSKGTVYLYFDSKDDLLRGVITTKVVPLLEAGEAAVDSHTGSATELLATVIRTMWDAVARNDMQCLTRLVHAELPKFPELRQFYFDQVILRHRRLLREIARRGVATGEFRPAAVELVPLMVPPLVVQLNQVRSLFGGVDPEPLSCDAAPALVIALVLDGIRGDRPQLDVRRSA